MYDALKQRRFDGQSDPLGVVLSLKLYEVQTQLSLTRHWWSGFTLLANAGRLGRVAGGNSAGGRAQRRKIRALLQRQWTPRRSTPPEPTSWRAWA